MISKQEVEHIAKLARLELTEKEIEKMQKDLTEILDYFNLLKKAPKRINEEIYADKVSGIRKDEPKLREASSTEKLIASAPDKKDGYIKVKNIF